MRLAGLLESKRSKIVDRWTELAFGVYPPNALGFFGGSQDRFRNPVGHVTRESLGALFDGLIGGRSAEDLKPCLDAVVRLRAVQELAPSEATGFLLPLKRAVREALADHGPPPLPDADLSELDDAIDRLTLQAFDLFMGCRETIYQLRIREIKSHGTSVLQRRAAADAKRSGGCET